MKIGIVSDGKFGDRAFEVIRQKFPVEWIDAPFPQSMVVDDLDLPLPDCDLYISYVRHPDVALAIIEKQRPVILGVSFGPGFLWQAKRINGDVVAPVTMCSLENSTGIAAIDEYATVFGKPIFDLEIGRNGTIDSIRVLRGSPCGSTVAACAELPGTTIGEEQLRHFGLRICHFCRAPRLGKTCDKELAGLIHVRELIHAIGTAAPDAAARVTTLAAEMETLIEERLCSR